MSINHKFNKMQAGLGDVTVQQRVDEELEKEQHRKVLDTVFRSTVDRGAGWISSLRQAEHDNDYDGLLFEEDQNEKEAQQRDKSDPLDSIRNGHMDSTSQISAHREYISQLSMQPPSKPAKVRDKFHKRKTTYD